METNGIRKSEIDRELDQQFKKTLCIIKQYIPYITNKEHIEAYRIWLEKLSQLDSSQKYQRNLYLQELKMQIQTRTLKAPFTTPPPAGKLVNLQEYQWHDRVKENIQCEEGMSSLDSTVLSQPPCVNLYGVEVPQKVEHRTQKLLACPLFYPSHQTLTAELPFDTRKKKQNSTLPTNTPVIQKFATKNFNVEDDSSWCDVSEISSNTSLAYASGDSFKNEIPDDCTFSKMLELIKKRDKKKNKEIYKNILKDENEVYETAAEQDDDGNETISKIGIKSLYGEVDSLKKRLTELQGIKHTLELHGLRGQDTLDILELELKATQAKVSELHSIVIMLDSKLKQSEMIKQREIVEIKKKMTDSHQKEIQLLKELDKQEIIKLQNLYQKKLFEIQHEYSAQIEKIKNTYENDIVTLKKSYQNMLETKEQQIHHLEETVQNQCARMEDEVKFIQEHLKHNAPTANDKCYVGKIKALENCVMKLDKIFKRSEKEYQKQINKLKKKIKACIKTNQLLIHSQKLNTLLDKDEKQEKIDCLIRELESHYKTFLESVLQQALSTKMRDEAIIADLRERLLKIEN